MSESSIDTVEVLHKFNRAVFARRLDEFDRLLEEYSMVLSNDENWILRYVLLLSPNKAFFEKAYEACVKYDAVLYSWMLEGPKN